MIYPTVGAKLAAQAKRKKEVFAMRKTQLWFVVLIATLALAPGAFAGKGGTKGGGTGSASVIPVTITFRDCTSGFPSAAFANLHPGPALQDLCPVSDDRVKSDNGFPYEDSLESVEAFISSTGGAGDLGLILSRSTRGVFLDFTDCASGPGACNPPFTSQLVSLARIDVDARIVRQNGLLGMVVGEKIGAPMKILYQLSADEAPGFVNFNPAVNGNNPCKNKSNFVTAERTSDTTWEIIFDANSIACATLPGGRELAGTFLMPLQFTVQIK
ncbi:MAG: hypothetical protein ACRD4D_05480 [Candidatus Acidiferrales bacterium]